MSEAAMFVHRYAAFGRIIISEVDLPELTLVSAEAALTRPCLWILEERGGEGAPASHVSDEPVFSSLAGAVVMDFPGAGRFRIDAAAQKIWFTFGSANRELLRLPLLGPVIATFLHLTGTFVLHASAVAAPFGVVAFLGDKGAGKSTTAAALLRRGLDMVSDDLLVCGGGPAGAWCEPSFPQLKLTPQAFAALPIAGASLVEAPFRTFPKQQQRLSNGGGGARRPLAAVCDLRRGEILEVRRLDGGETLAMLLRYAYTLRYGRRFLAGERGVTFFKAAASLASGVCGVALTTPSSLDRLDAGVPDLLEALAVRTGEG